MEKPDGKVASMKVVPPSDASIAMAAEVIRAGSLVAFPTETVYGLGVDATNGAAVASLYETKGRPSFNPLISHVADRRSAEELGEIVGIAPKLVEAFWPGALTLVVRRTAACTVSDLVTAGLDTIAIRVPSHPLARRLIAAAARPLAAPSANRSGRVSPTTAGHVAADYENAVLRPVLVIDGGATEVGVESTVVDCSGLEPALLRPGGIPAEEIETVIGRRLVRRLHETVAPQSPGQLASHYAPRARVRLDVSEPAPGEAYLAFGSDSRVAGNMASINLSSTGDLIEAAANLFSALRTLDATEPSAIAVAPIPEFGLGEAINDRLRRAAAPK